MEKVYPSYYLSIYSSIYLGVHHLQAELRPPAEEEDQQTSLRESAYSLPNLLMDR